MDLAHLHHLGSLGKPWGHRGELTFLLNDPELAAVEDLGVLFVDLDGLYVPFRVSSLREHPRTGAVVKFVGLDDPQSVAFLVNARVFAPPGHEEPESPNTDEFDPDELLGMHVIDEVHGELGEIIRIEGADGNPLMVVGHDDHEILIPIVNELITGIDIETGSLIVATPPGLVDLYRGE